MADRHGRTGPAPDAADRIRVALIAAALGLLLVTAVVAAAAAIHRDVYSAGGFVRGYLGALEAGDAPRALAYPGADAPDGAAEGLLRSAAMGDLADTRVLGTAVDGDGVHTVAVQATLGGAPVTASFAVERTGTRLGILPEWRFQASPLGVLELDAPRLQSIVVNGFEAPLERLGTDAPLRLAVFAPGEYALATDDALVTADVATVAVAEPGTTAEAEVDGRATGALVGEVEAQIERLLSACVEQDTLFPTGCPFGFEVADRITSPVSWELLDVPALDLVPADGGWRIAPASATVRVGVEVRSLFDGTVAPVTEDLDVPLDGTVEIAGGRVLVSLGG